MTKKTLLLVIGALILERNALAERPMRGTYTVPMPPPNEHQNNTYEVKFHSDSYDQPSVLNFPLPAGLVGKESWVTFKEDPQNPGVFMSSDGKGQCSQTGRILECQFRFNQVSMDLTAVEKFWVDRGVTQTEIADRLSVSRSFGGEPIGILTYELRGRDKKN